MSKPKGFVLYEGPSKLDDEPIVVIATLHSSNSKTGDMIQTWIMRADIDPMQALKSGADASVCGDCPLRGVNGKGRTCYVNIGQAPLGVWRSWQRGLYPNISGDANAIVDAGRGRQVRLGAYGDPAAAPAFMWSELIEEASGHTGYTHQWRNLATHWSFDLMASVDTAEQALEAQSRGWRTFRASPQSDRLPSEKPCPSALKSSQVQCISCPLSRKCNGAESGAPSIWIETHGSGAKHHPNS